MPKLRVLVVDDAVVMRRLFTEALQRDPTIEVVGTAPNGRVALQKLDEVQPDLVTLDLEMPDLDGLATLREIRLRRPRLPVIMLSTLTQRGALSTLDALAAGANDYVTKPSVTGDVNQSIAYLERELLSRIHAHTHTIFTPPPAPAATAPIPAGAARANGPIELVCIGTSTGGPNALAALFEAFTVKLPVPVAIVQHMPPLFTRYLAERLQDIGGPIGCEEATDGQVLQPGCAYLAPGGLHLGVARAGGQVIARLLDLPPENSCRPAVDVLFRTASAHAHVLGVVMTGMGHDGMRGGQELRARGGQLIAQDQATSVVWGMPGAVVQARLTDTVLPLSQLAAEITRRVLIGQTAAV